MLQFYFLSILLNAVAGVVMLFGDRDFMDSESEGKLPALALDDTFRLVLGILASVTGFFKLLTPVRGDVPVVGDLLPALAGLAAGAFFLLEFYKDRSTLDKTVLHPGLQMLLSSSRYIGMLALVGAVLHFLFPTVLFL